MNRERFQTCFWNKSVVEWQRQVHRENTSLPELHLASNGKGMQGSSALICPTTILKIVRIKLVFSEHSFLFTICETDLFSLFQKSRFTFISDQIGPSEWKRDDDDFGCCTEPEKNTNFSHKSVKFEKGQFIHEHKLKHVGNYTVFFPWMMVVEWK